MYLKCIFYMRASNMRTYSTSYADNPHLSELIPVRTPATESPPQKRNRSLQLIGWLMPGGAFVVIAHRLSNLGSDVLIPMLEGLGAIACMLIGLGIFLWCVRWGVTQDD